MYAYLFIFVIYKLQYIYVYLIIYLQLVSLKELGYLNPSSLEMYHYLVEKYLLYKNTIEGQFNSTSQLLHLCTTVDYKFKYHLVKTFYHQFERLCESLSNKWKIIFTTSQAANLDLVYLSSLTSASFSNWLECSYLVTITLPITCMWKLTLLVFKLTSCSNTSFMLCKLYFQKESIPRLIQILEHSNTNYCMYSTGESFSKSYMEDITSLDNFSVPFTIACIETQRWSVSYVGNIDTFRSFDNKKAGKELTKNLPKSNEAEISGLLHSASNQNVSLIAKNPASTSEAASKLKLPGDNQNSKETVKPTSFATNILPGATVSHDLHYETNFDKGMPPLSMEETRKNVRPVPKEKDVDSILQSYQKTKKTLHAVGNISQPYIQDRTLKPPAKIAPSSIANVNNSHRLLPRRACLVYLEDQYHLDTNLLSQPRATKYLIKVRAEITPGRYLTRLELQCSR